MQKQQIVRDSGRHFFFNTHIGFTKLNETLLFKILGMKVEKLYKTRGMSLSCHLLKENGNQLNLL